MTFDAKLSAFTIFMALKNLLKYLIFIVKNSEIHKCLSHTRVDLIVIG